MKIQQIRNAMVRIRYAGKTFLTDPWLAPRGSMGTFRDYPMFRCRPEEEPSIRRGLVCFLIVALVVGVVIGLLARYT